MKQSSFPIDRLLYTILKDWDFVPFTIWELREAYMARLDTEPTIDPSTVRRHVDKQVLRMYQSNWVDMTVDPNTRDLVFTVQHVPKHIELEFTPPMVDKTPMIAKESDEVDSDILNCTSSLSLSTAI